MKATIIINTNNQNKYLKRAIISALNQNYFDYEVIIADLSKNKNYTIRQEFKKNKKIKFLNLKEKFLYPTQNQLYAIKQAVEYSKGQYIFLLDGDDYFSKDKLRIIFNYVKNNKKFLMDKPIVFNEFTKKKLKKMKLNKLKKNYIYQIFINNWPSITCTSAITIKKEILKKFFKITDPFKYKHLAIDIQLAAFANLTICTTYLEEDLTFKSQNNKNLDRSYSNLLYKKFWIRRWEQHKFFNSKNKKIFKGLDYLITGFIVYFFLKIF